MKTVAIWLVVFVVVLLIVRTPAFHALTEQLANPYAIGALVVAFMVWLEAVRLAPMSRNPSIQRTSSGKLRLPAAATHIER